MKNKNLLFGFSAALQNKIGCSIFLRHGKQLSAVFTACLMLFCACNDSRSAKSVRIISWNLQTFFDAQTDGTEYAEFRGTKSSWNREKYEARLDKLAAFIKENRADIYVFQEVENAAVLQDIANRCAGAVFFAPKALYGCFSAEKGAALGTGLLSRLPLEDIKIHRTDIRAVRTLNIKNASDLRCVLQPPLRPLLQISVRTGTQAFTLFACHWKSKSGGEKASDIWRGFQEALLADRIRDMAEENPEQAVIVCGDFNRDLKEFDFNKDTRKVCFTSDGGTIELCSGWINAPERRQPDSIRQKDTGTELNTGSYYFRNKWEKIDHFFYTASVNEILFYAVNTGAHADKKGIPLRYNPHTGSGYSDHLPLLFEFSLQSATAIQPL